MQHLFEKSKDYKEVLSSNKHFCYDETNFQPQALTDGIPHDNVKSEIDRMTQVIKRLSVQKYLKDYFEFHVVEGIPSNLKGERSRLFFKDQFVVILYHLILFKAVYLPPQDIYPIPNCYQMVQTIAFMIDNLIF